jgi:hypothetical protein
MRWRIFAHPNAISKNVHSVAVARLRVFTQPRPEADVDGSELLPCKMTLEPYFAGRKSLL